MVPKDVADRFEAALSKHHKEAGSVEATYNETHKSGMEPVAERVRNLTAVAEVNYEPKNTRVLFGLYMPRK
jgi:hypothetical protein